MAQLNLVSPIPPSVNHYLSYRAILSGGRALAVPYEPRDTVKYKKEFTKYVKEETAKQGWDLTPNKSQHFYFDTWFYFPRLDMDANNYFKVMLDAITDAQCIWLDDNVVCERVQSVRYDSENPRIEIAIHPVDYIGIFDSLSQHENFVSRCIGCTRYKRNCSLLKAAEEGRIQEEIVDGQCLKFKMVKNAADEKKG